MEKGKTNAARVLDKLKIPYQLHTYTVDEKNLSAVHVAETIGLEKEQIFKTLVLRGDKTGILVAVIPGALEINLKSIAKLSGNKNAELITVKELPALTGYIRGGCSPLAMKKNYPVYIDESCFKQPHIYISAGLRGKQIEITPADLIKATGAVSGDLCN
jgi:Cys-tRNA(Pro)/Cys-tRNA(Cys) deacylase